MIIHKAALKRLKGITGDISLPEVSPEHFDQYKARRLGKIKPIGVDVELRTLRSIFSTAKR